MTLLRRIERHLCETGVAATRFGRDVLGDPRFVHDLRQMGRVPRLRTERRIDAYLASDKGQSA